VRLIFETHATSLDNEAGLAMTTDRYDTTVEWACPAMGIPTPTVTARAGSTSLRSTARGRTQRLVVYLHAFIR
jgi:hypothetical protein